MGHSYSRNEYVSDVCGLKTFRLSHQGKPSLPMWQVGDPWWSREARFLPGGSYFDSSAVEIVLMIISH